MLDWGDDQDGYSVGTISTILVTAAIAVAELAIPGVRLAMLGAATTPRVLRGSATTPQPRKGRT